MSQTIRNFGRIAYPSGSGTALQHRLYQPGIFPTPALTGRTVGVINALRVSVYLGDYFEIVVRSVNLGDDLALCRVSSQTFNLYQAVDLLTLFDLGSISLAPDSELYVIVPASVRPRWDSTSFLEVYGSAAEQSEVIS